ncbi:hypothetical protein, partial [Enterovibrio norvegicus]|uniref:hypothetical protein n=1 Tax=Enterovibrio norvegicus TaxID=188144 RepID=UPI001A7E14D5
MRYQAALFTEILRFFEMLSEGHPLLRYSQDPDTLPSCAIHRTDTTLSESSEAAVYLKVVGEEG